MLSFFRKLGKSWVGPTLFGLLIIATAAFGFSRDLFTGPVGNWVVATKDRKLTGPEFKARYDQAKGQAEQQAGQPITPEMAVQTGFDQRVLTGVADEAALASLMVKLKATPSEKLFTDQLQQYPGFFDRVTGKFDQAIYASQLAQVGLTPAAFKRETLDNMALNHVSAAMGMGLRAPRLYAALAAALYLEKRDIAYFELGSGAVAKPAAPTDAQLAALLKTSGIKTPELRELRVVRFSAASMPATPIDQAALQKRYEFEKDALNQPERRSWVAISGLKDAAQAREAAARLARNEDPAAVAKAYGKEPVTNTGKAKIAIADKALADAVFATDGGKVTAPVQTSLGFAVAKITGIVAGSSVSFEQARPQLEQALRQEAALQKAYDQTETYTKSRAAGATMEKAAADAGVKVTTYPAVSAEMTDRSGAPVEGLPAPVARAAFDLAQGEEGQVTEVEKGEYFVVRVTKVTPEAVPPLAEVRDTLTQAYIQQKTEEALIARADALNDRLKRGATIESLAAEAHASVKRIQGLDRVNAQQRRAEGPILGPAFNADKAGETFTARLPSGIAIGRVEKVTGGETAAMGAFINAQRDQFSDQLWQDYVGEMRMAAAKEAKVKTSIDRARAAIGVDAETIQRLSAPPKAAAAKTAEKAS